MGSSDPVKTNTIGNTDTQVHINRTSVDDMVDMRSKSAHELVMLLDYEKRKNQNIEERLNEKNCLINNLEALQGDLYSSITDANKHNE